jgi:hypothetical protein
MSDTQCYDNNNVNKFWLSTFSVLTWGHITYVPLTSTSLTQGYRSDWHKHWLCIPTFDIEQNVPAALTTIHYQVEHFLMLSTKEILSICIPSLLLRGEFGLQYLVLGSSRSLPNLSASEFHFREISFARCATPVKYMKELSSGGGNWGGSDTSAM